jgi:hypothetical protein
MKACGCGWCNQRLHAARSKPGAMYQYGFGTLLCCRLYILFAAGRWSLNYQRGYFSIFTYSIVCSSMLENIASMSACVYKSHEKMQD